MKNDTRQAVAKRIVITAVLAIAIVSISGCGDQSISYKPTGFPFKVSVNTRGEVLFGAEASISTPIGTFSIEMAQTINPEEDILTLIVRDRRKAADKVDAVYRIQMEDQNVIVTLDGRTTLEISKRLIVIDVTEGIARTIEFTKKNQNIVKTPSMPNPPNSGNAFTEDINGVKLEMQHIPAGSFLMGSVNETEIKHNEWPQHRVNVPSFYLGKYEVTQTQWKAVMGGFPREPRFNGYNLPVEGVSWYNVKAFCEKLSVMTNKTYRLPSEAEWEYACRAGTNTRFYSGSTLSPEQANFDKGPYNTTPVGSFSPNMFGLFDMHGNVYEWCEDVYHENYNGAPSDGSAWLSGGNQNRRVTRGGSWYADSSNVRSADRTYPPPTHRSPDIGFRLAMSVKSQ